MVVRGIGDVAVGSDKRYAGMLRRPQLDNIAKRPGELLRALFARCVHVVIEQELHPGKDQCASFNTTTPPMISVTPR